MSTTTTVNINEQLPGYLRPLAYLKDYLIGDSCIGGPKPLKLAHVINLFKAGTLPFCVYLMSKYNNWGPTMMTYTSLHGSYGILWLIKEFFAPDRGWDKWVTIPTILAVAVCPLGAYWYAPYVIASAEKKRSDHKSKDANDDVVDDHKKRRHEGEKNAIDRNDSSNNSSSSKKEEASPRLRLFASMLYGVGAAIMFGSDIQKYFVLKQRPGLITDGFFALCRHPNYLGEMMLYGAFATLTIPSGQGKVPWAILGTVWSVLFGIQMLQKEVRMSRHAGWEEYVKKTAFLIPFIW